MNTHSRMQGTTRFTEKGKRAARSVSASSAVENLTRLGYVVRGLLYGTIGLLALQVAVGKGGRLTDPQGAIAAIGQQTGGQLVLYLILIGLIGYSLWGVIRAVFDPLHKGNDLKGLAQRIGFLVSAIAYGLLIPPTYALIQARTAAHSGGQTAQTQQITASILSRPWGPAVVGIVAVILIGVGLFNFFQGFRQDFDRQFQPYALDAQQRTWVRRLGRFGTSARGVVFTLIGVFLFQAAYQHNANQAQGIDGALYALLRQPAGQWLLGIVAVGLISFGVYSVLSGIWLRLKRTTY